MAYIGYHLDNVSLSLQMGSIDLNLDSSTTTNVLVAICSVLVTSQAAKTLVMFLHVNYDNLADSRHKWKWLAYALISKRTRELSAIESLASTLLICMNIPDMEAFISILSSAHPAEELYACHVVSSQKERRLSKLIDQFIGSLLIKKSVLDGLTLDI
ncbi:hypothetical protein F442_07599 [Phytophthora nicotianae P10297]|uniref:Uncharacterized protein n=3 Tax=Phytophthora nicotianae TaxID=4792 RepID=W2ZIR1_PHYNI|nr:hypothetical protein F444_07607 [Phytophthora nicotianae P1976]ETP46109.1 hypothetical protein F442_07599 [Phytophthora nicotianae P10297]KUF85419.1 hypothetical protein AM587_10005570 [Phytophthora nicotianae]